jgi:hypothetical protein
MDKILISILAKAVLLFVFILVVVYTMPKTIDETKEFEKINKKLDAINRRLNESNNYAN